MVKISKQNFFEQYYFMFIREYLAKRVHLHILPFTSFFYLSTIGQKNKNSF